MANSSPTENDHPVITANCLVDDVLFAGIFSNLDINGMVSMLTTSQKFYQRNTLNNWKTTLSKKHPKYYQFIMKYDGITPKLILEVMLSKLIIDEMKKKKIETKNARK